MKPLQNWNVYPDFSKETGVLFSFFSSSRFRPTCSNKKHDLLRAAVGQRTKKKQMGLLKQDEKGRIYDVDGSRILHQLRLEEFWPKSKPSRGRTDFAKPLGVTWFTSVVVFR